MQSSQHWSETTLFQSEHYENVLNRSNNVFYYKFADRFKGQGE